MDRDYNTWNYNYRHARDTRMVMAETFVLFLLRLIANMRKFSEMYL